jgi:hypothetical protein
MPEYINQLVGDKPCSKCGTAIRFHVARTDDRCDPDDVATHQRRRVVDDIITWLRGLETRLTTFCDQTQDPQFIARRGIYDGIADDIKDKWRPK